MQGTAILLAWLAVVVAVVLGVTWSAQVSRPVERLAQVAARVARGDGDEPLVVDRVRELETLVQAFERMRAELRDSRARLIVSERHAAWGMMARVVAHEVANPLTPIAVAVADLKRSYERNRADFPTILDQAASTVGEEIRSLRRLLQEFSDFGRLPAPRLAPCSVPELMADVRTLYGHEIASGRLVVAPSNPGLSVVADRALLREALVNLIHNGFEAVGDAGQVAVTVAPDPSGLRLMVADDGPGLDAEARARLFTPDFTTKQRGRGLGLVIVERIVTDHGGTIAVDSEPGHGTTFRIVLPREPRSV
jgi:nitrogen fixation/metabolism regulation signal transduction histidine kinase